MSPVAAVASSDETERMRRTVAMYHSGSIQRPRNMWLPTMPPARKCIATIVLRGAYSRAVRWRRPSYLVRNHARISGITSVNFGQPRTRKTVPAAGVAPIVTPRPSFPAASRDSSVCFPPRSSASTGRSARAATPRATQRASHGSPWPRSSQSAIADLFTPCVAHSVCGTHVRLYAST